MEPIFNPSYSAVGRVALVIGSLKGVEVVTGKSKLALIALPLNYIVHYHFFKQMIPAEAQILFSVSVISIGVIYTLLETLIQTESFSKKEIKEGKAVKAFHSFNEMVVLAAGVVIVASAILTTDNNIRVQCVIATTLYGLGYAKKFYKETAFIHEVRQKVEFLGAIPEFLVDETTDLKEKEIHYLVGGREFESLKRILSIDMQLNNPCLIGAPGSGKTELIRYFASEVNHRRAVGFEGWRVFSTTSTKLIEGTKYLGTLQEKIGIMFRYFEGLTRRGRKVVVFIDEIHQAVSTGKSTSSDTTSIAEALLTYMTNPNIRVVAATTYDNYQKLYQNGPFRERFEKVMMPRMTESRRQRILEVHLKEIHSKYPELQLPRNMFERVQLVNRLKRENSLRRDIGLLYITAKNMHETRRSVDEVLQEDLLDHIEGDLGMLAEKGVSISEEFEGKLVRAKEQLKLGFGGEQEIFSRVIAGIPGIGRVDLDQILGHVVQHWHD